MKIITAGVTSAMLAVGIAGSVAAYRTQAATPDVIRPASQETSEDATPTTAPHGKPEVEWAPCSAGSTLEKGACVTDVVETVVLPAPAPAALPGSTPEVTTTPETPGEASDDSDHSAKAEDDQDEADDHGDDQDEADDHGDDQDEADDDHEDDHGDDHEDDHEDED